jgi:DNA-binding transcriptional regulator of glucitol operon
VNNFQIFVAMLAAVSLMALSALAQHKYYARTVRRLVVANNRPDCVLVSGRGKTRLRGAIVILVLRRDDEQIQAAAVMEGSTVLARFVERPDWVGLSARDPLPDCTPRAATAVADARTHVPGRRKAAPPPRPRFAPHPRGGRPVKPRS